MNRSLVRHKRERLQARRLEGADLIHAHQDQQHGLKMLNVDRQTVPLHGQLGSVFSSGYACCFAGVLPWIRASYIKGSTDVVSGLIWLLIATKYW